MNCTGRSRLRALLRGVVCGKLPYLFSIHGSTRSTPANTRSVVRHPKNLHGLVGCIAMPNVQKAIMIWIMFETAFPVVGSRQANECWTGYVIRFETTGGGDINVRTRGTAHASRTCGEIAVYCFPSHCGSDSIYAQIAADRVGNIIFENVNIYGSLKREGNL